MSDLSEVADLVNILPLLPEQGHEEGAASPYGSPGPISGSRSRIFDV